jgi:hypothetical protein
MIRKILVALLTRKPNPEFRFRVKGRDSILLTNKVAIVIAKNKEEATSKAAELWGQNVFIQEVKEHGEADAVS